MKIVLFIIMLFLCQCTNSEKDGFYNKPVVKEIERLTTLPLPPIFTASARVYLVGSEDSIVESSFDRLKHLYEIRYKTKYSTFGDFLFDFLNQKAKFDTKASQANLFYTQCFVVEPSITRLYNDRGINGIIQEYCVVKNGDITLKSRSSENLIRSISYYFFLNQYLRADDDVRATINYIKFQDLAGVTLKSFPILLRMLNKWKLSIKGRNFICSAV